MEMKVGLRLVIRLSNSDLFLKEILVIFNIFTRLKGIGRKCRENNLLVEFEEIVRWIVKILRGERC